MAASAATLHDEVSATCVDLIFSDPFFGHFLLGISREISSQGPTLWVRPGPDDKVVLGINPVFWRERLDNKQLRMGGIKHEILHVVMKHLIRFTDTRHGGRAFDHQRLFNIAADLVVNQYIDGAWLIPDAVTLQTFADLSLQPEQDVHYYYEKLLDLSRQDEAGGDAAASESRRALKDLLGSDPGARGGHHGFWEEMQDRSEAANNILEDWVDRQIVNATSRLDSTNTWGDLPGGLVEYLKEFLRSRKPRVDWRRTLRLFSESSQKTYVSNTMKKPSRRYKSIARWPDGSPVYELEDGKPVKDWTGAYKPVWESRYPGLKIRHKAQLLIGIDTSGSLNADEDLPRIFQELHHLARQDIDLLVAETDTQIARIYSYPFPEEQLSVKGRGGTDFNELLKFANGEVIPHTVETWSGRQWVERTGMRLPFEIDGIVYFTDGQAETPSAPIHLPMLWVIIGGFPLSPEEPAFEELPGQKVIVESQI